MIESVLRLLKIHRKMIFGNSPIIVQHMFRKTPKPFNAVHMIFGSLVHQLFRMVDFVMLAKAFQRVVAFKRISVVHRTFLRFLSDNRHQFFFRDMFHDSRVHLSFALQKPKYDTFTLCSSSSFSLAPAAEVRFVNLNLSVQFLTLKFGDMIHRFSKALVDSGNRLVMYAKIMSQSVRWLLLIKPLNYYNLFSQLFQRLLFSTIFVPASDVSSFGFTHLERAAENTLSSFQKVGRTTENVVSCWCHMGIVVPYGYEPN